MRFSVLSFAVTLVAAAGLVAATRTSAHFPVLSVHLRLTHVYHLSPALKARGQQTIVAPLSDDPVGSTIPFQFADEVSPFAARRHLLLSQY